MNTHAREMRDTFGISPGDSVITQYGRGEVMIVADSTLGMGLPPRHIIQLPYGKLYSPANDTVSTWSRRASYSTLRSFGQKRLKLRASMVMVDVTHVVAVIFAILTTIALPCRHLYHSQYTLES